MSNNTLKEIVSLHKGNPKTLQPTKKNQKQSNTSMRGYSDDSASSNGAQMNKKQIVQNEVLYNFQHSTYNTKTGQQVDLNPKYSPQTQPISSIDLSQVDQKPMTPRLEANQGTKIFRPNAQRVTQMINQLKQPNTSRGVNIMRPIPLAQTQNVSNFPMNSLPSKMMPYIQLSLLQQQQLLQNSSSSFNQSSTLCANQGPSQPVMRSQNITNQIHHHGQPTNLLQSLIMQAKINQNQMPSIKSKATSQSNNIDLSNQKKSFLFNLPVSPEIGQNQQNQIDHNDFLLSAENNPIIQSKLNQINLQSKFTTPDFQVPIISGVPNPTLMNIVNKFSLTGRPFINTQFGQKLDDNQRSPLSNVSVDGSQQNAKQMQGQVRFDVDISQQKPRVFGARDRTMSNHTQQNQSMCSGESLGAPSSMQSDSQHRGQSCNSSGSIGGSSLSVEERRNKVLRYWEKKKQRMNKDHVRYHCRKDLAENRFRYHGRFISKEQMDKIMNNKGGLDEIYNPTTKCTPKTKQIFKVEKSQRRTSCCSNKCPSRKSTEIQIMNIEDEMINDEHPVMAAGYNQLFGAQTQSMNLMAGVNKEIQGPLSSQDFFNKACLRASARLESEIEQPMVCSNIGPLDFNQQNASQNLLVTNCTKPSNQIPLMRNQQMDNDKKNYEFTNDFYANFG